MTRRPSLKAVAAAAGVSPATASNAYNRPDQLSAAVRERVLDVAATLGYAGPDPTASSLRSRRTGSIGVLFAQELTYAFEDPYFATLLGGVADVITQAGRNLLLMPVGPHRESRTYSRDEEQLLLQGVRRAAIDGALADGVHADHPALRVLRERGVPVVGTAPGTGEMSVVVDDRESGRSVGEHLRGLGHRHVVLLADSTDGGDPRVTSSTDSLLPHARLRLEGVSAGVGSARVVLVAAGANTHEAGRAAMHAILALHPRPTAIAATTDVLALGVLDEARARDLTSGVDLSVTGFDDVPAAAAVGLTTIRQPVREKGRAMATLLLDTTSAPASTALSTELVVRTSTGPAPEGVR